MADGFMDFLEGLSGAFGGVTKGLTEGAKPFEAWENVRTKDLANDRSDIQLRYLGYMQDAREGLTDYYGNVVAAADSGNRLKYSKDERDIFGVDQDLALNEFLASPGFQETVSRLDPSDPEYRTKLAAAISMYNPQSGVAAYDKYKIPEMEQRNLNQQAIGQFVEAYARQKDPGATFVWNDDGTAMIIGSNGEATQVPTSVLIKAASMSAAKDPYAAISAGIKDQIAVNGTNIAGYNAVNRNGVTTPQQLQALTQQRLLYSQELTKAQSEINAIMKTPAYQMAAPEVQQAMVQAPAQRVQAAQQRLSQISSALSGVAQGARPGAGVQTPRGPAPQGGSSVTSRRAPVGDIVSRATGGAGVPAIPGPGRSSEGGAPYPQRSMPISEDADFFNDPEFLIDLLRRQFGAQ